jgi:hypothetical protein
MTALLPTPNYPSQLYDPVDNIRICLATAAFHTLIVYMPSLSLLRNLLCSYVAKLATPLHHTSYGIVFHLVHRKIQTEHSHISSSSLASASWHILATYNFQWTLASSALVHHKTTQQLWLARHITGKLSVLMYHQYFVVLVCLYGLWSLFQQWTWMCHVLCILSKHPDDSVQVCNILSTHQDSTATVPPPKGRKLVCYCVPGHMGMHGNEATWLVWFTLYMTPYWTGFIQTTGKGDYACTCCSLKPSHRCNFFTAKGLNNLLICFTPKKNPIKIPIWCVALSLNSVWHKKTTPDQYHYNLLTKLGYIRG